MTTLLTPFSFWTYDVLHALGNIQAIVVKMNYVHDHLLETDVAVVVDIERVEAFLGLDAQLQAHHFLYVGEAGFTLRCQQQHTMTIHFSHYSRESRVAFGNKRHPDALAVVSTTQTIKRMGETNLGKGLG